MRYAHAGHPRTPRSVQRYCANGHLASRLVETAFGEKYMIDPTSIDRHIAFIEEVRPVTTGHAEPRQDMTHSQAAFNQNHYRQAASQSNDMMRQAQPSEEILRQVSLPVMPNVSPQNGFSNFASSQTSQNTRQDMTRLDAASRDVTQEGSEQQAMPSFQNEPVQKQEVQQQAPQQPTPNPLQEKLVELLEKENNFLRNQITTKDEQIKDLTERARETNHLIGGLQRMLTPLLGSGGQQRDEEHQTSERKRFWQGG